MSASPLRSLLHRFFPFLAVLGSVTALGIGTSWAKHWLFPVVGAQGTTAVRVGFSALLVLLLWRPWRWHLSRSDAQAVVLYGAALGAMNLMFYMSLRTLPFGLAVAIEFSGPLAVAIWSSRRAVDFVWVALAIAGLGLLLPLGLNGSTLDPVGVLYALGAAVSSAIPISLEMMALKRLPKEAFGIMISMEPAVAAILALVLLGEHLSAIQWLAIGCIVAASMGSAMTAGRPSGADRAAPQAA